jgi:transcriptional regulator of arginine metabolism
MDKEDFLDKHILNIISKFKIKEQSELQNFLEEKGLKISQATLSRRLKKLNVVKIAGRYSSHNHQYIPTILDINTSASGIIVIHTLPGSASSLAFFIDQKYILQNKDQKHSVILGTIAGDDTIILITKDETSTNLALKLLQEDFPQTN